MQAGGLTVSPCARPASGAAAASSAAMMIGQQWLVQGIVWGPHCCHGETCRDSDRDRRATGGSETKPRGGHREAANAGEPADPVLVSPITVNPVPSKWPTSDWYAAEKPEPKRRLPPPGPMVRDCQSHSSRTGFSAATLPHLLIAVTGTVLATGIGSLISGSGAANHDCSATQPRVVIWADSAATPSRTVTMNLNIRRRNLNLNLYCSKLESARALPRA